MPDPVSLKSHIGSRFPKLQAAWRILRYKTRHGPYFSSEGSPHLHFVESSDDILEGYIKKHISSQRAYEPKFLDVGGAGGRSAVKDWAREAQYYLMDIEPAASSPKVITGNICDCPQIVDSSFDIVFSNNVFEHIAEPWKAAQEIGRILRPGGICLTNTVFSWRYHPVPQDYWRFTHSALSLLFEKYAGLRTLDAGYNTLSRRSFFSGGKIPGNLDGVPIDGFGGWMENWVVFHVGRKDPQTV